MNRTTLYVLLVLSAVTLIACQEHPLTPAEIQDQHRFQTGCRPEDYQGYERNAPYCDHMQG